MRYDWSRGGNPVAAGVTRFLGWWITVMAVFACPLFLYDAVAKDWTLAFPALLIGGGAVVMRLGVRRQYGVREESPAVPQKTRAEELAEAVEALRQQKWDAVTGQAFLAKPPPRQAVPMRDAETGEVVGGGRQVVMSVKGLEPGSARRGAALGPCAHPDAEPVDLITGERVAWVCPDCPADLPADWAA